MPFYAWQIVEPREWPSLSFYKMDSPEDAVRRCAREFIHDASGTFDSVTVRYRVIEQIRFEQRVPYDDLHNARHDPPPPRGRFIRLFARFTRSDLLRRLLARMSHRPRVMVLLESRVRDSIVAWVTFRGTEVCVERPRIGGWVKDDALSVEIQEVYLDHLAVLTNG